MTHSEKEITLLAPAGSFETLQTALNAGADAVYFGVAQLNMRAKSTNNFTLDDIEEVVSLCHHKGAKAYLTINTVLYNHDLSIMRTLLERAKTGHVDAVIASDPAAMSAAAAQGIPVHVSTQANVSNIESIKLYAHFADLVVLARELSLMQVKEIAKAIERDQVKGPSGQLVKLEVFAHGALCMAISGKCYLSLHTNFSSANRGACVQNCRHAYIVKDKETDTEFEVDNEYIMSAKDLCTIDFLDKILDAGVSVLKIEGRARSSDYVDTTTRCYKQAIAALKDNSYSPEKVAHWKSELAKVYNRGFWDGYYLGRKMGEWATAYGSVATERRILIGKALKYYPNIEVGEFEIQSRFLNSGDDLMITGNKTGMIKLKAAGLRVNDDATDNALKGDKVTFKLHSKIMPNDKLYKIVAQ